MKATKKPLEEVEFVADKVKPMKDGILGMIESYSEYMNQIEAVKLAKQSAIASVGEQRRAEIEKRVSSDVLDVLRDIDDSYQRNVTEVEEEFENALPAPSVMEELKAGIYMAMKELPEGEYKTLKAAGFSAVAKRGSDQYETELIEKMLGHLMDKYPPIASEIQLVLDTCFVKGARSVALQVDRKK